jgi:hypothetical protein
MHYNFDYPLADSNWRKLNIKTYLNEAFAIGAHTLARLIEEDHGSWVNFRAIEHVRKKG